ncbi:efflux RND transporter periplasmic adaptor subunit [Chitinophaga sp. 30R24]|uniref:efflux RND transporter periplasmic adaptor subunit n=1 Tax=Chitinophaga sp. 30R24 TaxID=3248838 RepID=UPI003B90EDD6
MRNTFFKQQHLLLLLAGFITLLAACSTAATDKKTPVPAAAIPGIPVDAIVLKAQHLTDQMEISGTLAAVQEVNIMSELSRKVTAVYAVEGKQVSAGSLLFTLDDADLQAQLDQYRQQEKLAKINEERLRDLIQNQAAIQQDYDQALTTLRVLQAQIRQLQVNIAKTRIVAPFGGRIGLVNIHPGALVTPGQTLTTLEDKSRVKIDFYIPEKYSSSFRSGAPISFHVESNNKTYEGVIIAEESKLNNDTRTLLLRAISNNAGGELLPGQSARISLHLNEVNDALMAPSQVLIPSSEGYSVFVARNGKAEVVPVKTGERNANTIHITDGLQAGDTLIVSNLLRLSAGTALHFTAIN